MWCHFQLTENTQRRVTTEHQHQWEEERRKSADKSWGGRLVFQSRTHPISSQGHQKIEVY